MIHNVLGGCFMHWVHLRRVLKMSRQECRSLCELTDFKQKRGNPMKSIFHVIFPACSFQADQNILITCITLVTNKSHSAGTPTVKKQIKLPQKFIFLYLRWELYLTRPIAFLFLGWGSWEENIFPATWSNRPVTLQALAVQAGRGEMCHTDVGDIWEQAKDTGYSFGS